MFTTLSPQPLVSTFTIKITRPHSGVTYFRFPPVYAKTKRWPTDIQNSKNENDDSSVEHNTDDDDFDYVDDGTTLSIIDDTDDDYTDSTSSTSYSTDSYSDDNDDYDYENNDQDNDGDGNNPDNNDDSDEDHGDGGGNATNPDERTFSPIGHLHHDYHRSATLPYPCINNDVFTNF
jgi:hypothetical protein